MKNQKLFPMKHERRNPKLQSEALEEMLGRKREMKRRAIQNRQRRKAARRCLPLL